MRRDRLLARSTRALINRMPPGHAEASASTASNSPEPHSSAGEVGDVGNGGLQLVGPDSEVTTERASALDRFSDSIKVEPERGLSFITTLRPSRSSARTVSTFVDRIEAVVAVELLHVVPRV